MARLKQKKDLNRKLATVQENLQALTSLCHALMAQLMEVSLELGVIQKPLKAICGECGKEFEGDSLLCSVACLETYNQKHVEQEDDGEST